MKLPRRQFLHLAAGAAALPAVSHIAWLSDFQRVARTNFLAQHTAELRYLFATLTADGYDETDRRISAWMQAQWVAFARDGAPADNAVWRPYGEDKRVLIIGDDFHHGRIEDDPVVPLLNRLRTLTPPRPGRWHSLFRLL